MLNIPTSIWLACALFILYYEPTYPLGTSLIHTYKEPLVNGGLAIPHTSEFDCGSTKSRVHDAGRSTVICKYFILGTCSVIALGWLKI